jgi:hypothetical protein
MGEIAERSQWFRGKDPIMEGFSRERREILRVVAGRVDHPPGYLIDTITDAEIKAKRALSDLNYQIIAEAVDREMAQQGINYDLQYRAATIEWEVEKAGLLDALTRELTDAKKTREDREKVLADLAVEVGLRQVALINAKALLDNEMEQVRKEIAEAQGQTLPKEVELANARLATAQRKLDIIPHLQALLAAQEDLLIAEQANIPLTEELIDERIAMIPIKEDLVGLKEQLITARDALTAPNMSIAEKKKILAQARVDYETRATDKLTPSLELVSAMESLNTAMQVYVTKRGDLVDPYLERAVKLNDWIVPRTEYAEELTATIPYIQELAEKRQELIAPSLEKAEALATLATPLMDKAEKAMELAAASNDMAMIEHQTKQIYLEIENLKLTGIDADLEVMAKRLEEGDYQEALVTANVILRTLQATNRAALAQTDAVDSAEYLSLKESGQNAVIEKERLASDTELDTRFEVATSRIASREDSVKTTVGARAGNDGSIETIARDQARAKKRIAETNAAASITSRLIHTLS